MTAAAFLRDFTAFSVQIAVVGVGIAMLLKLVKLPAGVRYFGLRLALVASLVVPWVLRAPDVQAPALAQRVMPAVSQGAAPATDASTPSSASATGSAAPAPTQTIPWLTLGFGAFLIGLAARIAWLGVGVFRLLRLKRAAVVVDAPEYSELQQQFGTRATIAQVAALPQPATFGVRRPIVLLPDTLADASSSLRRAVVAHELFHVRRRDWLSVMAEEAVRTALWFHPAILWMTSQIQLAREEIVDELTVRATGDRRTYVEALLAFADTPGLSPAPAFAQRRQLFHRILSVSKENAMSRPRMLASAAVLLATVTGASWYASTLFPIVKAARPDVQTPPVFASRAGDVAVQVQAAEVVLDRQTGTVQAVRPVNPVTPENPIPRRTRGVTPARPAQFSNARVVVTSRVTLDRNGAVTGVVSDACGVADGNSEHVVCNAFVDVVSAAIRQWRYDRPAQGPIQFYVTHTFRPGEEPAVTQSSESRASSRREAQDVAPADFLRAQAELERVRAEIESVNNQSRELERAQRLYERGLLSQTDYARARAELAQAQVNAARVQAEIQAQNGRSQPTDEQARAALEQTIARLREAERAMRKQYQEAARRYYEAAGSQDAAELEEKHRAELDQLRDAVRRAETGDASQRPLLSPSGRAPLRADSTPGLQRPVPTKTVKPQHSPEAMRARAEGTVTVEALVDEQGHVADARVVKSIPLLDQSALDAAKQWEFKPAALNGEAVPVLIQLEMNFTLK